MRRSQGRGPHRARENQLEYTEEWYERIGGSPDDRNLEFGYWRLQPGAALEAEFAEPRCRHWSVHLCNHWMENLADYFRGRGYVDSENAAREPGGRVRIVVAETDPGVANWIDPGDRNHGAMGVRFVEPPPPPPKCPAAWSRSRVWRGPERPAGTIVPGRIHDRHRSGCARTDSARTCWRRLP